MGMTFAEKVLAAKSGQDSVVPGQIVIVKPDHLMSHDNTAAIVNKIQDDLKAYGVSRRDLPVIVLDHVAPAADEKTATNHQTARAFVKTYDLPNFFDVGTGVCHRVLVEQGLAKPGALIVGSDSHTCSYGAVGVFSTGVDRTEASALLLSGQTWLRVPETIKVALTGELQPPVSAKDLVLSIIGEISAAGANYRAVEFHGNVVSLTVDERFTISNMGIEMGAKIAVFPVDGKTKSFLSEHGVPESSYDAVWADADAKYVRELTYDLSKLEPVVAFPHKVDNVKPVSEAEGMEVQQCLLGTCTNGSVRDLEIAAEILDGKTVAPSCRLLVLPSSRQVLKGAMEKQAIQKLVAAGGILLPPGCGPCLGAHQGALAPGEKCLSTANRNFKGRMGCKEAEIYLASPATVAATALHGKVVDPRKEVKR